ncbi:hypothetical protein H6G81_16895 [Scytonema hofmannii FACHB-248]|uniref:Uncharacterized protein n=1 Tax=Scytonema hofmannii FACHB-248 TaxID=1842502 RepID=A0ABR8GSQ8_9CYAN|nr:MULTISPECIES: hypothetical protein [Nostocales]MBD2606158.1 hypothetical protein [Scytonema hofmannii FACHB-248]
MFRQIPKKNFLLPTLTTSYEAKLIVPLAEHDEEFLLGGVGNKIVTDTGSLKAPGGNITVSTVEILTNSKFYMELDGVA